MGKKPDRGRKRGGSQSLKQKHSLRKQLKNPLSSNNAAKNPLQTQKRQEQAPPTLSNGLSANSNAANRLSKSKLFQKRDQLRQSQLSRNRKVTSSALQGSADLEALMSKAQESSGLFEQTSQDQDSEMKDSSAVDLHESSRKTYMRELRKVLDDADVVLEVLDARDPMGCRSEQLENEIAQRGKKLILVLNKIDLVPPHVLEPWLAYLRRSFPTIAFKASTQQQKHHLGSSSNFKAEKEAVVTKESKTDNIVTRSGAVGTEPLMQLLKNYCRSGNSGIKTAISVGLMGYPNVGKSSVLNSLKRRKAASVASTAGHTKVMQRVALDKKISLIDSPGVVFDTSDSSALLLRNSVNVEDLANPAEACAVIIQKADAKQLLSLYNLSLQTMPDDVMDYLAAVARAHGKLGRGGVPDREAAAKLLLQDWNRGKIAFFTPPPAVSTESVSMESGQQLDAQIVTQFSEDFDLDKVLNPTIVPGAEQVVEETPAVEVSGRNHSQELRSAIHSDSDSNSDSDMGEDEDPLLSMAGGMNKPGASYRGENLTTAVSDRRKAKQWRKLKRRAQRQQIGAQQESELGAQLEQMGMKSMP